MTREAPPCSPYCKLCTQPLPDPAPLTAEQAAERREHWERTRQPWPGTARIWEVLEV